MRIAALVLCAWGAVLGCSGVPPGPAEQAERARERADLLHERAIRLQGDPGKIEEAARLHRESARLRAPSDPRAFDCYAQASQVLLAGGKAERAQAMMEEAAGFALARGDSGGAARSWAEALRIAAQRREYERVLALAERVRTVARPPALAARDSAFLEDQITTAVGEAETALRSGTRAERAEPRR